MLLARRGLRVLLVDRATFPSDSMRAHFLRGAAVSSLTRWGLLDRVAATGSPALPIIVSDFGDGPLAVPAAIGEGVDAVYGPRRFVLDQILVEAAAAAGAEVRQAFTVDGLLWDDGAVVGVRGRTRAGQAVSKRARLVIGADGLHSFVARAVSAPAYDLTPAVSCGYYGYFDGPPLPHGEVAHVPNAFVATIPTNDGLTLAFVAAPIAELNDFRTDTEGAFYRTLDRVPWIAETVRRRRRAERWRGTGDLPNVFRRPFGPGWALVGDAGYHQDPITARGIGNAFRDAELLADAVTAGLSGARPLGEAMADYEQRRNEAARPWFDEAIAWASFRPMPPQVYDQRAALRAA
jgi:2-polyprenyl-6-methoxyphenol hydroxylase-like FAD-dependent oxidoreductase